jgi:uncharacterized membrane protein
MLDRIGATEEQCQAVENLLSETASRMRETHESHRALEIEIAEILSKDGLDMQALENLKARQVEQAIQKVSADFDVNVRMAEILTPEQRRQLFAFAQEDFLERPSPHRGPPSEAVDSCAGLAEGAKCNFSMGKHRVVGRCRPSPRDDDLMLCVRAGFPPSSQTEP